MKNIKRIETAVKEILEENKEARDDDFILIAEVYNKLVPECINLPFSVVMLGHNELKLPVQASITRARRKIQAQYKELRASKKVQEARKAEEEEYKNYSRVV